MNIQILTKIDANMTLQQIGKALENVTLHLQKRYPEAYRRK